MKTKCQILKYAYKCKFSDDDWKKVLDYCRELPGPGRVHKTVKPISNSTYSQFIDWIDSGYGSSDIVCYGNTIGMIGISTPEKTSLIAYLSYDGRFIHNNMEISPDRIYEANTEQKTHFILLMKRSGLRYVPSLGDLTESYMPDPGGYAIANDVNGKSIPIIFRSADSDVVYTYASLIDGKVVKDAEFHVEDVDISEPTMSDISSFKSALKDIGEEWVQKTREFRPMPCFRVGKKQRYWYISDHFTVISDADMHTRIHDFRFNNKNYFNTHAEAVCFLEKLLELRNTMKKGDL